MQIIFPTTTQLQTQVLTELSLESVVYREEFTQNTGIGYVDVSVDFWAKFLQKFNPRFEISYSGDKTVLVSLDLVGRICNFSEDVCELVKVLVSHHRKVRLKSLTSLYEPETGKIIKPQSEKIGSLGRTVQDALIKQLAGKQSYYQLEVPYPWFPTTENAQVTQGYFRVLRELKKPIPYFVMNEILKYGEWPLPAHYVPSNWVWWNRFNHTELPSRSWRQIREMLEYSGPALDRFLLSSGKTPEALIEFFLSISRFHERGIEIWNFTSEGILLGIPNQLDKGEVVSILEEEFSALARDSHSWYPREILNV